MKKIIKFLKKVNYILVLAWVLPAGILLTILYLNFLPFGYEKTLTIDVGSKNDTKGQFRLEESSFLGSRQELDGETFRYLDGLAYAVYEPKVVLRNATIEAELTASTGVSFILPPDLSEVEWDYDWNADNIGDYFEAEASEKNIYNAFLSTPSKEIIEPTLTLAKDFLLQPFAIKLTWQADRFSQLLTGGIYLYQDQKELYLNYQGQILRYPLPDYFLGEERNAIVAFDGKSIYIATDKNQDAEKTVSMVIATSSISDITIYKSKDLNSWSLHQGEPSFIEKTDGGVFV